MAKETCKMDYWLLLHLKGFAPMGVVLVLQKPSKHYVGKAVHAINPRQNWYLYSCVSGRPRRMD